MFLFWEAAFIMILMQKRALALSIICTLHTFGASDTLTPTAFDLQEEAPQESKNMYAAAGLFYGYFAPSTYNDPALELFLKTTLTTLIIKAPQRSLPITDALVLGAVTSLPSLFFRK